MKIIPFRDSHQPLVDRMLTEIQREFSEPFTSSSSKKMKDANRVLGTRFWVLMDEEVLAGTVGIIKMKDAALALKSFFILSDYRGTGASRLLLNTVLSFSKRQNVQTIYLGTMDQMKAAHKFYKKNGFAQIAEKDLPPDFPANVLDTVFYRLKL